MKFAPNSKPTLWLSASCTLLSASVLHAAEAPPLPELAAYRTATSPTIDGLLNEDCWRKAPVASQFWKADGSAKAENSPKAQIAFDNDNLYIAYRCPLKDAAAVKAAKTLAKDALFGEDTVELFLEPFSDNSVYYHYAVNAVNGRFVAQNFGYPWTNPWESATHIGENEWTAEIKVPFASLATNNGKTGPEWRINLTRGTTTWAPTFTRYHQPEFFGRLTGVTAPLQDHKWHVAAGAGNIVGDPSLTLQLYHDTTRTRKVKYALEVKGPEANAKPWRYQSEEFLLLEHINKTVDVPVPIMNKPEAYQVEVTVTEAGTNKVLAYNTTSVEGQRPAHIVWNRSFYMGEATAQMDITCSGKSAANGEVIGVLRAVGKTAPLQSVKVKLNGKGQGVAKFNIQKLPVGNYEVVLKGQKGLALDVAARPLLQNLAPKAGAVQYTNSGLLLRNGKPIFPTGVYYVRQDFGIRKGLEEEYSKAGFNTYPMEWGTGQSFINEAEAMKTHGVTPIVGIQNSSKIDAVKYQGPETLDYWEKSTRELVKEVSSKASDNILAWYTWDEPPLGIWYDLVKRLHNAAKEEDPYRPTFVVLNNPGIFKTYATDATDILAVDPYPGFPGGRIRVVSDWMDEAIKAAPNKPVIAILQAFYEPNGRMPTTEELRCMTYASIVHGAKGVLYFSYNYQPGKMPDHHPETWEAVKALGGEMKQLEAALVAPPSSAISLKKLDKSPIEYKVCGDYLIAVNQESTAVTAAFEIKVNGKPLQKTEVFAEKRSLNTPNGRLTENFAPLAVHIYKLR